MSTLKVNAIQETTLNNGIAVGASGAFVFEKNGDNGKTSNWGDVGVPRLRLTRTTPDQMVPAATDMFFCEYDYGFQIEYKGQFEFHVPIFSIVHDVFSATQGAVLQVGDNYDQGGVYLTSYTNADHTVKYSRLYTQYYDLSSHGDLYIDVVDPTDFVRFRSSSGGVYSAKFAIRGDGVIFPIQAATGSAPAYAKGGLYFDTTLNKLRVGGAAGWETVTSN